MDPTHFLAAQTLSNDTNTAPASGSQIDAFYAEHGRDVFARLYRLRRWTRSIAFSRTHRAQADRHFATLAQNR